ncbi:MAG TPA: tetratricopeptide repeat protein [Ferrovibrio sp.]|uniref:tetratricopeptide repeat protein n=1 Tax=Ferrovibrio sp. TaxID=1917215 RepID=UPI002ED0C3ED
MTAPQPKTLSQWLTEGVQAHQAGQVQRAQECYSAALRLDPKQPDALHLLGVIADQEGHHQQAVDLIRQAIERSPRSAIFHNSLGNALLAVGDEGDAEAAYRRAIVFDPDYADALFNLANLQRQRGLRDEALDLYGRALRASPGHTGAKLAVSGILLELHRYDEAIKHLAAIIHADPRAAEARDLAAMALRATDRIDDALLQHRKAIALAPSEMRYRENYAISLIKTGHERAYREAEAELSIVLDKKPNRVNALAAMGAVLLKQQRHRAALPYLEQALSIGGEQFEVLINCSMALIFTGRSEQALDCCERAIRLAPDDCVALAQRGAIREHLGDLAGALADYEAALRATNRRTPMRIADITFKRGLILLSLGRLAEGWPLYRSRMQANSPDPRGQVFEKLLPRWDGIVRPEQRLLVWGEQGVGDQVLYASMLPDLRAKGANFTFLCDPRLVALFARSFPGMHVEPAKDAELELWAKQNDVQIGLGDLGTWLRPTLADFPPPQAYLRPDPVRVAALRQRYRSYGKRLVIGLTWRSRNPSYGAYKSTSLMDWAPLLLQQDVLFVDMQYGDTADERRQVREELGVEILHDDSIDAMKDLDGFTAQAAALDLMIGSSNSGIHLAAATGCHCWVMVPGGFGRIWYWLYDRTDSPWYPNVRLFRQPRGAGDAWQQPIEAAVADLEHFRRDAEV